MRYQWKESQEAKNVRDLLIMVYTPDGDNILKAVADALNGVCYKDDKCLIKMSIEKFYSDVPRIEVVVKEAITDENDSSEMMRELLKYL